MLALQGQPVRAQDSTEAPSVSETTPAKLTTADVLEIFDALVSACDQRRDAQSLDNLKHAYDSLFERAEYEVLVSAPKAASVVMPQVEQWLSDRATAGSPTAQFWMAARQRVLTEQGSEVIDISEAARWYRLSAEQGFAPAEYALGQILMVFTEYAHEPYEAERWLLSAAKQGNDRAGLYLVEAVSLDADKPDYKTAPEVLRWIQRRADSGDADAQRLLKRLTSQD